MKKLDCIVKKCSGLILSANKCDEKGLEYRLLLGRVIIEMLMSGCYGDSVTERLAERLTQKLGYKIYPQRLYECAKAAQKFRTVDEIYVAAKTKDVTWKEVLELCGMKGLKSKIIIQITLDKDDSDLAKYRSLPFKARNEFLKESLRLGIKTMEKVKRLPDITTIPSVTAFASMAFPVKMKTA